MGKEVRITVYDVGGGGGSSNGCAVGVGCEVEERVFEWEAGLPDADDLMPLSQSLISSELLSAFNITPEPYGSLIDVNRASQNTMTDLRGELGRQQQSLTRFNSLKSVNDDKGDEMVLDGEETADVTHGGSDFLNLRSLSGDGDDDCDGDGGGIEETEVGDLSARASKRPRLVWTPQLHKRFVEVVAHLGVKNAVPKTIMQLMNVEGLTRENVASHLQKYRLYLKRMQGLSPHGRSTSDHLFASTSAPQNQHESSAGGGDSGYRHSPRPVPMHYHQHESSAGGGDSGYRHSPRPVPMHYHQQIVPMPYPSSHMVQNSASVGGNGSGGGYHHGYESNPYRYNMTMQQRDWYQHRMTPNDK